MDSSKNTAIVSISLGIFCLASGVPTLYTISVGIITVLQVIVCLYYDSLVVLSASVHTTGAGIGSNIGMPSATNLQPTDCDEKAVSMIVNELFPEEVRHRLYLQKQDTDETEQPILDSYDEVTVLFADIVGYTAWSASRTSPKDVFVLLETLYAAFDELALKHHIFKVETIGDCYLAMAGAPIQDPLHAQHMVQFSLGIMTAAHRILTQELAETLATAHLQLRVGLHTGPIVAGVLRGAKSRFQVFGDTINTASRMESTSMPSGIQVSLAVRECLSHNDEEASYLLKSRQELVDAKGKGLMKTYWVEAAATHDEETENDEEDFSSSTFMSKSSSHMCSGLDDLSEEMDDPRQQFSVPLQAARSKGQSMASMRISSFMLSSVDDCFGLRSVELRYE